MQYKMEKYSDETLLGFAFQDDRSMSTKAIRARAAKFEIERRANQ